MTNRNGTMMSVADFRVELAKAPEKLFAVAGDERLLAQLPRGNWVGGTIPYLMTDEEGGLTTRDSLMVQELLTDERAAPRIAVYDRKTVARVTEDAPTNGYTFLMMRPFPRCIWRTEKTLLTSRTCSRIRSSAGSPEST